MLKRLMFILGSLVLVSACSSDDSTTAAPAASGSQSGKVEKISDLYQVHTEFASANVASSKVTTTVTREDPGTAGKAWLGEASAGLTLTGSTVADEATASPKIRVYYADGKLAAASIYVGTGDDDINQIAGSTGNIANDELDGKYGNGAKGVAEVNNDVFGFTAQYMVGAQWLILANSTNTTTENVVGTDSDKNTSAKATLISGFAVAGLETGETPAVTIGVNKAIDYTATTMPTTDTYTFAGKGIGLYIDATDGTVAEKFLRTKFDVTAEVEFGNSVKLSTENTMAYSCAIIAALACTGTETANTDLDIAETTLTISGNGATGSVSGTGLTGSVNARFYGKDAAELGGTFNLTAAGESYQGLFGAEKGAKVE